MSETTIAIDALTNAIQGSSVPNVEKATRALIKVYRDKLQAYYSSPKPMNSERTTSIYALLTALKKLVKSPHYASMKTAQDNFVEQIFNLLNQLASFPANKDFCFGLFKRIASIVTYVVDYQNISKWAFLLTTVYVAGSPQSSTAVRGISDMQDFHKPRLTYIFEYISKKSDNFIEIWWYLLVVSIMPTMVNFKVMSESGQFQTNHIQTTEMSTEMKLNFVKFLMYQKVRNSCQSFLEKTKTNASISRGYVNTFNCLISFFVSCPPTHEFVEGMQFLISLWRDISTLQATNIVNLIQLNFPETLYNFLYIDAKVASFTCLKIYQTGKCYEESAWAILHILREQWKLLLIKPFKPEIISNICKQFDPKLKLIIVVVFITLIYDMKYCQKQPWDLITAKNEIISTDSLYSDEVCIIIRKLLSVVAVTLSPFFIGLDKEELQAFGSRTAQRNARTATEGQQTVDPNELIADIFLKPNSFEELIRNNEQFDCEFNGLKQKTGIRIFDLSSEGWTFNQAKDFVQNIIFGFQKEKRPSLFNSFISSLSSVRDFVPISLQKQPTLITSTFFDMSLSMDEQDLYDVNILNSIACSSKQVGALKRTGVDPSSCDLWVSIIIKYICHSDRTIVNFAVPTALEAIAQFAPHSFVLIEFVMQLMMQCKVGIKPSQKYSYVITSIGLFSKINQTHLPKCIEDNIEVFKKHLKDPDVFSNAVKFINATEPLLIRTTLFDNALSSLGNLSVSDLRIDLLFHTFFCVLMEEATGNQQDLISRLVPTIRGMSFTRSLTPLSNSNIRELTNLSPFYHLIIRVVPNIGKAFVKKLLPLCKTISSQADFTRIIRASAYLSKRAKCEAYFSEKLLLLYKELEDKTMIYEAVESLVSEVIRTSPPLSGEVQHQLIMSSADASILGVSRASENVFSLCVRTGSSFITLDGESISQKSPENVVLPQCETEEEEEKCELNFSSIMQNYVSAPKSKIIIEEPPSNVSSPFSRKLSDPPDVTLACRQQDHNPKKSTLSQIYSNLSSSPSSISFVYSFFDILKSVVHETSKALTRRVAPIFSLPPRECMKIGVIYVADKQLGQLEILSNTHNTASLAFHDFLCALGEPIDITKHKWYNGKLEGPSYTQFPHSIYYNDDQYEIMFHVSTLLPDNEEDTQRILKKKHIGNDNVHIVWCENTTGYDTTVITSQFNDAHIVIYPWSPGFYHVVIKQKLNMECIGPLPEDSIITAGSLSYLVRQTAINHDRAARSAVEKQPRDQFKDLMQPLLSL